MLVAGPGGIDRILLCHSSNPSRNYPALSAVLGLVANTGKYSHCLQSQKT